MRPTRCWMRSAYTKKDAEGYRLLPSGKRVGFELSVVAAFGA